MNWIDEIRKDIGSIQSSPKELKKFGILVGGVLILISGHAIWKQWGSKYLIAMGICGLLLVALGLLRPVTLKKVYQYWMGFAFVLGSIVSRIVLSILFYLILTPIGLTARLFKKHFFSVYKQKDLNSFWINREKNNKTNYERMS